MCPVAGKYCLYGSEAEGVCDEDEADDFSEFEIGLLDDLIDTAPPGNTEK